MASIRIPTTAKSKSQLDQASNNLDYWTQMVSTEQAAIEKTQSDLTYWTSQQSQLSGQLNTAQTNVNQLSSQVSSLEGQESQLQSKMNSDQSNKQSLETTIGGKQTEASSLQNQVISFQSQQSGLKTDLQQTQTELQATQKQAGDVSYEINAAIAQPYLIGAGSAAVVAAIAVSTLIGLGFSNVETTLENISGTSARFANSAISRLKSLKRIAVRHAKPEAESTILTETEVPAESKIALPVIVKTKSAARNVNKEKVSHICDCGKSFKPMTDAQWKHVQTLHEISVKHKERMASKALVAA